MYIPFDQMPPSARIWVYQADKYLTLQEQEAIITLSSQFLENWTAHKKSLQASAKFLYNHFLVIAVDESFQEVSGCSIDSQTNFIKHLEQEYQINLLNRSNVAFYEKNDLLIIPFHQIAEAVSNHAIKPETLVFNNTISKKYELENNWLVPSQETWLKKYFSETLTKK
ncbi:MAG: hypothetical protein NW207_09460 [Cytophagales bacterium]|nr:hypothetical protein [Cytophagales bacterium]